MKILYTERLALRPITIDDAAFYLRLANDPSWMRFIGDTDVRTLADARNSILNGGPIGLQERLGFSLYLTKLKGGGVPIGLCGLIKRDSLPDIDIGFAFLPEFRGNGYAYEATSMVVEHGAREIGLTRLLAITSPDNQRSIRLIERLGLTFERNLMRSSDGDETQLFVIDF